MNDIFNLKNIKKIKYNAVGFTPNDLSDNPLHIAAMKNRHGFIARFLELEKDYIEKQKDLNVNEIPCVTKMNKKSHTPLFSAVLGDNVECVKMLLKSDDLKINTIDIDDGNSIVHVCAKYNNVESLRYLLKHKKFLKTLYIENDYRESPLHIAAQLGNLGIFQLIIAKFNDGRIRLAIN